MTTANIVSFSLYGNLPIYTEGAIRNAELVHEFYPGWGARFYVDCTVPDPIVLALREREAEIVFVAKNLGPMYGRYWRMLIAADPNVQRFLIRDCDSRLNSREKAAVNAWLASGFSFHIMRDSIHHKTRMLAGMWGGVGGVVKDIETLIDNWGRYSTQGDCDRFASEVIYPIIADDYICHDSWGHFADATPFPSHAPLQGTGFVGARVLLENNNMDVWRRLGEYDNEVTELMSEIEALRSQIDEIQCQQRDALAKQRDALPIDLIREYRGLKEAGRRESNNALIRLLRSGLMKLARPVMMALLDQNRRLQEKVFYLEERLQKLEQVVVRTRDNGP
jgi:hypothetical protein